MHRRQFAYRVFFRIFLMAHRHRLIGVSVHMSDVTYLLGGNNDKAASPETFPTGNNAVPKLSDRNSPVSVRLPSQG